MRNLERFIVAALFAAASMLPAPAQVLKQLTDAQNEEFGGFAIDDAGVLVLQITSSNDSGSNPLRAIQVTTWTPPVVLSAQLTTLLKGLMLEQLSVTDDGGTVLFASPDDPLGTNPDGSVELFTMQSDGAGLTQVTDTQPGPERILFSVISGDGSRILYTFMRVPPGGSGDAAGQLYAIDPDGQNEVQLTQFGPPFPDFPAGGPIGSPSISDDGSRIVFTSYVDPTGAGGNIGDWNVWQVMDDGSGLASVSTSIAQHAVITGDGAWIAYGTDSDQIRVVPFSGGTPQTIAAGRKPTLSDTGLWVYYEDLQGEIGKIRIDGQVGAQLTSSPAGVENRNPVVSGGNTRIVFVSRGGAHPGGFNPDGGPELMVMDADGSNLTQLSSYEPRSDAGQALDLTADGSRVAFPRDGGLRAAESSSSISSLVVGGLDDIASISMSGDGGLIAFDSTDDPLGTNPCGESQIFTVLADGSGLTQLTPGDCSFDLNVDPVVAADGSVIVFQSTRSTPNGGLQLFSVAPGGGPITAISDDGDAFPKNPRVSADGQWVVYQSRTDIDGMNPGNRSQIFRARVDGTLVERIVLGTGHSLDPDLSADGTKVSYVSRNDPLATNADMNPELFLYDIGTAVTTQLTFTDDGGMFNPRISGDGSSVYFGSNSTFFESPPPELVDLYRVEVESGTVRRAGGLRDVRDELFQVPETVSNGPPRYAVDDDGTAVIVRAGNPTGGNLEFSREVFLIDFDAFGTIEAEKNAPARVRWDPQPSPVHYDLIRGDVANLSESGGAVDLGEVVCLADDLQHNVAIDPDQPAAGQVFFYIHRGSQGNLDGPGTWNAGTEIGPRTPGPGACAD